MSKRPIDNTTAMAELPDSALLILAAWVVGIEPDSAELAAWNPLADDGQNYRLAVAADVSILVSKTQKQTSFCIAQGKLVLAVATCSPNAEQECVRRAVVTGIAELSRKQS